MEGFTVPEGFTMPSEGAPEAVAMATTLLAALVMLAISIGIAVVICLIITNCFKRIPQQHREMEPGMVWLLLIPCFNLIWNFFVWPKLDRSFKNYFDSVGITDVGDCGKSINLAYCIVTACCIIPCVNYIAGPVSLVLLIICLVKANGLKNRIPSDADRITMPQDSGGTPPV